MDAGQPPRPDQRGKRTTLREMLPGCLGIGVVLGSEGLLLGGSLAALVGDQPWTVRLLGLGVLGLQVGFVLWVWRRLREARAIDDAHDRGDHEGFSG